MRPNFEGIEQEVLAPYVRDIICNTDLSLLEGHESHPVNVRDATSINIASSESDSSATPDLSTRELRKPRGKSQAYLYTNVNSYDWTEHDVHYARLSDYLVERGGFERGSDLLGYDAQGGKQGFVKNAAGLKPLLEELVHGATAGDVVIRLEFERRAQGKALEHAVQTMNHPPSAVVEYCQRMVEKNEV